MYCDVLRIIFLMAGYRMFPHLSLVCKEWKDIIREIVSTLRGKKLFSKYLISFHTKSPRRKHLLHYINHVRYQGQLREIITRNPIQDEIEINKILQECIYKREAGSQWNILVFIETFLNLYPKGKFLGIYKKEDLSQDYYYTKRGYIVPSITLIKMKYWEKISTRLPLPCILEILGYNLHKEKKLWKLVSKLPSPTKKIATYILRASLV